MFFSLVLLDQVVLKTLISYCPKCDETIEGEVNKNRDFCRKCKAWLSYQCTKCSKRYEHFQSTKYHVLSKCNPQKAYKCEVCNYKTLTELSLSRHMTLHQFKCSNCNSSFTSEIELSNHKITCGVEETLKCELCPFETTYKRLFRNHIRRHASTMNQLKDKAKSIMKIKNFI